MSQTAAVCFAEQPVVTSRLPTQHPSVRPSVRAFASLFRWFRFIDLMDSCGVLSSTCWAIFASLAYWRGNSVNTSYQYFNTVSREEGTVVCKA